MVSDIHTIRNELTILSNLRGISSENQLEIDHALDAIRKALTRMRLALAVDIDSLDNVY